MKLPNKVTSYSESVLSKFPVVLSLLSNNDLSPSTLYYLLQNTFSGISEFIEILDCLFALKVIELNEAKGVLHYVKRNIL